MPYFFGLVAKGFIEDNRFTSYAPIRREIEANWFVDGCSYMSAIADVLESAHEEIMICDWWLSPEIYMKRPVVEGERWRLDKILQRKAVNKLYVLSVSTNLSDQIILMIN